ncbi:cation-translocating P-type ATPase [Siphonobacter curvatus]|uniref:ATPase n=1 Tax=Siphonobacter curvatus TaxID=2094562 RepID=A0A2S7IK17_9BACT|nr:cation-transporting P-type ATPase [Siphonobacter curvatus]PQA56904.1 ATPase [Siphonobacter curvatus]
MNSSSLPAATQSLFTELSVDPEKGLSPQEAQKRREAYGPNALETAKQESLLTLLVLQFKSLIVYILAAAAILSFLLGDTLEGYAIATIILINAGLGLTLEWNAGKSMQALRSLGDTKARVWRSGKMHEIPSQEITRGDLLLIEAGDVIAADAILFEMNQLEVNESMLTGESLPVAKSLQRNSDEENHPPNRLYKGTLVTAGNGRAVVTGIGTETELGKISNLVAEAKRNATPLEAKLDVLAKRLIWITAGLAVVYLIVGLLYHRQPLELIETAVALAIAAIPEGMSVVATIALANGMLQLAQKKVIVKRLSSVETLGSTGVIFTDKTGTLTQNQLTVHQLQLGNSMDTFGSSETIDLPATDLLRISVLCNNASASEDESIGDPLEIALLNFAEQRGLSIEALQKTYPRRAEIPFNSDSRIMATLHQVKHSFYVVAVKGALEEVLKRSTNVSETDKLIQLSESMAAEGLRTLAFAKKELFEKPANDFAEADLTYLGMIGFLDPARTEVTPTLEACRRAGIKVIMVTGDHPTTALTIATQVGLLTANEKRAITGKELTDLFAKADKTELMDCRVFARVSPQQKLDLIELYQHTGAIVGMTGDGVNDAPALKKADIGIAMGLRGTQVAAETAEMVLQDDSFTSIGTAIAQGRVIFENIRKFVLYLLSCNLSEIFVVTVAGFLNVEAPLLPLQILFINIVTDVFPALALGVGKDNRDVMQHPPRDPQMPLLSSGDWRALLVYALVMTASVLGVYYAGIFGFDLSPQEANNLVFYTLAFAQLMHVFNLHSERSFFVNEITQNRYVWGAIGLCMLLLIATYTIPFLRQVLRIEPVLGTEFLLILAGGLLPIPIIQLIQRLGILR